MSILIIFILFIIIFLVVVEFFSILFKLTGLDHKKARFQTISLLTSTGFSTKESESVVQHSTRRKIASMIMIFGYASSVTLVSFIVNILMTDVVYFAKLLFYLSILSTIIFILNKSQLLDKVETALEDNIRANSLWIRFSDKEKKIINRNKGYGVVEIPIDKDCSIVGKSIVECALINEEIQVLNIDKGYKLIKFPGADYIFEDNDLITVYGNITNINKRFPKS